MKEVLELDVVSNIKEKYDGMTKTQRKIADYMLANPESMTFVTLRELSNLAGVSELTVLNLCAALGYENFNELKYEFRKYISILCKIHVQMDNAYGAPQVPNRELRDKGNLLLQVCQEEFDMTKQFFATLSMDHLFEAARLILAARVLVICGFGVSKHIADVFSARLALLGVASVVVNTESNDSIQAALPFLAEDVLLLAISYPDYYIMTTKVVEFAHSKQVPIMALTDSLKSPVAKYSSLTLTCQTTTRLFLNTIALPMMLVNFITTAINIEKSSSLSPDSAIADDFATFFE